MSQPYRRVFSRCFDATRVPFILGCMLLLAFLMNPQAARAQRTWYANVGAETKDEAEQANAFLPNEIWINAGDSIQWTWQPQHEIHTVTFLQQAADASNAATTNRATSRTTLCIPQPNVPALTLTLVAQPPTTAARVCPVLRWMAAQPPQPLR